MKVPPAVIPAGLPLNAQFVMSDVPPLMLERLMNVLRERFANRPGGSYSAQLFNAGRDRILKKIGEEATEVVIAAKDDAVAETAGSARDATRAALAEETADLVYHALVVLAERGLEPSAVIDVLRKRRR